MIYRRKPELIDACQFQGHDHVFELEGISLIKRKGLTGYSAKLAYIHNEAGNLITIRPNDYVFVSKDNPGKVQVMDADQFEEKYELNSRATSKSEKVEMKTVT